MFQKSLFIVIIFSPLCSIGQVQQKPAAQKSNQSFVKTPNLYDSIQKGRLLVIKSDNSGKQKTIGAGNTSHEPTSPIEESKNFSFTNAATVLTTTHKIVLGPCSLSNRQDPSLSGSLEVYGIKSVGCGDPNNVNTHFWMDPYERGMGQVFLHAGVVTGKRYLVSFDLISIDGPTNYKMLYTIDGRDIETTYSFDGHQKIMMVVDAVNGINGYSGFTVSVKSISEYFFHSCSIEELK